MLSKLFSSFTGWMVGPFLELKNTQGTGVDGKMIIEFALPMAYSSVITHHKIESRAICH